MAAHGERFVRSVPPLVGPRSLLEQKELGILKDAMVSAEQISALPFFEGMPAAVLRHVATEATEIEVARNQFVLRQNDEAQAVYFLLSGTVQFYIRFEGVDDLMVGMLREPGSIIGWSAFRMPYRYTASVRCEDSCRLLKLPRTALEDIIDRNPRLGYILLRRIAKALAGRLEQTRDILMGTTTCESASPVGV